MKSILSLLIAVTLSSVVMAGDVTFEELDVDKIFGDEPKLKAAISCLLDKEPCGEMQPLRDALPALIETDCSVCTPKQKEKYDKAKKILSEKYPEMYKAMWDKYSPKSE